MPSILLGCLLAGIPILVHLLHRQRVTPISWGAMQFLLETPLKVRRRRRVDNWLLMLVRMAILLLLALLLARPVVRTSAVSTSTPVDVAIVLDHSMSMGVRTANMPGKGGSTLFEQGIDVAQQVSAMLPSSGTMSIVLAERTPKTSFTPTPLRMGPDDRAPDGTPRGKWAETLSGLRTLKPTMARGDIPAAVAAARDVLSHGYNLQKVILVISDDQSTNWEPGDLSAWKNALGSIDTTSDRPGSVQVFSLSLKPAAAGAPAANVSVRGIAVTPAFIGVHRPAQVLATIANTGGKDLANIPVKLAVDGKTVATQTLATLVAGDSATIHFDYYFPQSGSHWVRVSSDLVDSLDADNAATSAVEVKPRLPVLIVDGQLKGTGDFPDAGFLLAAMQPVDPSIDSVALIAPKVISAADLATARGVRLEDYPIILLNDVPRLTRETVDRLAQHAQNGNGIWIILGPRTEETFINDVLARTTLAPIAARGIAQAPAASQPNGAAPPEPVGIDIREPANPAVALLTQSGQGEHHAFSGVNLFAWWRITPVAPELRTILATTTGDPIAMEMNLGKLGGKVLVWTTPDGVGDRPWNNFPLMAASIVPLVNETLFHLASGQDSGQPRQVDAGEPITWIGPTSVPIDSALLLCPDGATRTLQPDIRSDHYYVEDRDTSLPGLYEMRFTAPPRAGATAPPTAYFSVNVDPQELDPTLLAQEDFAHLKEGGFLKEVLSLQTLGQAVDAKRGTNDLWWLIGLLVLGLLVFEVAMTCQLVRQQAGKSLEEESLHTVMPRDAIMSAGDKP